LGVWELVFGGVLGEASGRGANSALAAPGGTAILFADFVSSETEPRILEAPAGGLAALMERVCREGGCFPGMNPVGLRRLLGEPTFDGSWGEAPEGSAPWVWDLGPRSYLVTAITCRRVGYEKASVTGLPWSVMGTGRSPA
jgi:hypothetical protein